MNNHLHPHRLLTCLIGLAACASNAVAAEDNWQRVQCREIDTLFANPGQGWMSQQRRPTTEPRFPCSVVYVRFNWADAEPAEGQYNWIIIDDVLAAWKSRGAAVAFRVMTCNAHSRDYYTYWRSSPAWLVTGSSCANWRTKKRCPAARP